MIRSLPMRAHVAVISLSGSMNELRRRQEGQALVEYALLLGLIAVVSIGVITVLGTKVQHLFSQIANDV